MKAFLFSMWMRDHELNFLFWINGEFSILSFNFVVHSYSSITVKKEMIFLPFHSKIHSLNSVVNCKMYKSFVKRTVANCCKLFYFPILLWFFQRGSNQAFPFFFQQNFKIPKSTLLVQRFECCWWLSFLIFTEKGRLGVNLMLKHLKTTLF